MNRPDIEGMMARCDAATPGPWSSCRDGKCPCSQVWSSDYPVADVVAGEWGDSYPAIRLKPGTGSIQGEYETYIEKISYSEVTKEQAEANRLSIANARTDLPAVCRYALELEAEVKRLQARVAELEKLVKGAE